MGRELEPPNKTILVVIPERLPVPLSSVREFFSDAAAPWQAWFLEPPFKFIRRDEIADRNPSDYLFVYVHTHAGGDNCNCSGWTDLGIPCLCQSSLGGSADLMGSTSPKINTNGAKSWKDVCLNASGSPGVFARDCGDNRETWPPAARRTDAGLYSLAFTVSHELGHVLGLRHPTAAELNHGYTRVQCLCALMRLEAPNLKGDSRRELRNCPPQLKEFDRMVSAK